jgi:alkylresorcinol/alkylpyrone synthase
MSHPRTAPQADRTSAAGEVVVAGLGSAFPPPRAQEELWDEFFAEHFRDARFARRTFFSTGVRQRHCAVDPTLDDLSKRSTGERMALYRPLAVPLARAAALDALRCAELDAAEVGLLVVVSCTGYATPGVDILLGGELDLDAAVQRLLVGHAGCHGGLVGLSAARDFVASRGRPALLVCVELSSLHLQPPTEDLGQVVLHSLFSDAAAAAVLVPGDWPTGRSARRALLDVVAHTEPGTADQMTWEVGDTGFLMGLSRRVPESLGRAVGPVVDALSTRNRLSRPPRSWAIHPGGPRVLDVVGEALGLDEEALRASRRVLAERGNCSSATVLLALEAAWSEEREAGRQLELNEKHEPDEGHTIALAFGPGLSLYGALFGPPT